MNYLIGILQTVLPVLAVLGIGAFCRQKNIFSREGISAIKSAAVNIALPAVLLKAFAGATYSPKHILVPAFIFFICFAAWLGGKAAARLLKIQDKYLPYLTTGFEVGMLGYTFFGMLYEESISTFALLDLGQVLFVFTIYKILVTKESPSGKKGESILRSLLTSPIIIAIIIGVVMGATGLYSWMHTAGIAPVFDSTVSFIAAPTSVMILLSIGYDLVLNNVEWTRILRMTVIRCIIMGIGAVASYFVLIHILDDHTMVLHAVCVIFITPAPYALPIFANDEEQGAYLSSALTVLTLFSILCFAVLACIS